MPTVGNGGSTPLDPEEYCLECELPLEECTCENEEEGDAVRPKLSSNNGGCITGGGRESV